MRNSCLLINLTSATQPDSHYVRYTAASVLKSTTVNGKYPLGDLGCALQADRREVLLIVPYPVYFKGPCLPQATVF